MKEKRKELIKLRLALGLSQTAIARKAGVSTMTINNLENGSLIQVCNIPAVASAYGIPAKELLNMIFDDINEEL